MANKYCDHGVYPRWTATPTWGVAMEGDGTAIGATAVPATVSINLSALTAAAGATFVVAGATLTCVASGAGANQFNAGSGATLATNLANAINAATNTVNAAATGWYQGQLRDMVYAKVSSTTLQIMTRAGSATYNANSLWQVVSSAFTGGSQVSAQFSGGVGGCWGWIQNVNTTSGQNNTILSSGQQAYQVGLWSPILLAGVRAAGDFIYVRANKTLLITGSGGYPAVNPGPCGSATLPVYFIVDDGTTWPADGQYPKITFNFDAQAYSFFLSPDVACYAHFLGKKYGDGTYSVNIVATGNNWPLGVSMGPPVVMRGFNFDLSAYNNPYFQLTQQNASQNTKTTLIDFYVKTQQSSVFMSTNFSQHARADIFNIIIEQVGASSPHAGLFYVSQDFQALNFESPTFLGFVPGSQLLANPNSNSPCELHFRNANFGGVTLHGPYASFLPSIAGGEYRGRLVTISSQYGQREFMIDTKLGFVEWNPARSYPTLAARQLDGITPWSILVMPSTVAANVSQGSPLILPRLSKINSLATGIRTVSVELAIEQTLAWTCRDVAMFVEYQADDGSYNQEDTYDIAGGALTPSTSIWSSEVSGQVAFSNGGQILHNKYKLQVTTKKPIMTGTEIGVTLRFFQPVANATKTTFVDPEVVVA